MAKTKVFLICIEGRESNTEFKFYSGLSQLSQNFLTFFSYTPNSKKFEKDFYLHIHNWELEKYNKYPFRESRKINTIFYVIHDCEKEEQKENQDELYRIAENLVNQYCKDAKCIHVTYKDLVFDKILYSLIYKVKFEDLKKNLIKEFISNHHLKKDRNWQNFWNKIAIFLKMTDDEIKKISSKALIRNCFQKWE